MWRKLSSRPLVLFKTCDRNKAENALMAAVSLSPKNAGELLKASHRRPDAEMPDAKPPGYITMGGGWYEAFGYWAGFGRFWDKSALDWLRDIAAKNQIPSK
jgi:hypothetical protein